MDSSPVDSAGSDFEGAHGFLRHPDQLGDEEQAACLLRDLICVAGHEEGAWTALCTASDWVERLMTGVGSGTTDLAPPAKPEDADWLAGRMAADFLAKVRPLPFGAYHLAEAAKVRGQVDELGAVEASKRAEDLCTLAAAALKLVARTWDQGPLPAWRDLLLRSPGSSRTRFAGQLVDVAAQAGQPHGRRVQAAIAAACIAIIDREFFGPKHTEPTSRRLSELAQEGNLPPLVGAILIEALATPRSSSPFARHLTAASLQSPPVDRAILDIVLENAIQGVGCPPRGVADLDPISRTLRALLVALVLQEPDDRLLASLLPDGLFTLGEDKSGMGAEDPTRSVDRQLWATYILPPLMSRSTSASQRDRALLALALLAQLDLRDRRLDPTARRLAVLHDTRGLSAFSVLYSHLDTAHVSVEARRTAAEVSRCEITDEAALAARIMLVLQGGGDATPASGGEHLAGRTPHPADGMPSLEAKKSPPLEAWLVWFLYDIEKRGSQAEVGRLAGERLKRDAIPQHQVSRMTGAVRAFVQSGGPIPSQFHGSGTKTSPVRRADPRNLEMRSPKTAQRPTAQE